MGRKSKKKKPGAVDPATKRQERKAQRAAKAEASRRRQKRAALMARVRRVAIAAVVVVGLGAAYQFMPRYASYTAGGEGRVIEGVQTFNNPRGHVSGFVDYAQTPPTGGQHNPTWLNCGIYTERVRNEFAVHSLEHGAVWVTYDRSVGEAELEVLRSHLPGTYVILSPYPGIPAPIVLSAWNAQLQVQSAGDPRIPEFFEEYWRNQYVPEPGALCSGGVDGDGRIR